MNIGLLRQYKGLKSKPVRNEVAAETIRKFAAALGDTNPLYSDDGFAEGAAHGRLIAPPTFCSTFDYGHIAGAPLPKAGFMQGEQYFEYHRPILAGDVLYCSVKFVDVYEKQGTLGNMFFLVFEQTGVTEAGEPVFFTRSNLIYRG